MSLCSKRVTNGAVPAVIAGTVIVGIHVVEAEVKTSKNGKVGAAVEKEIAGPFIDRLIGTYQAKTCADWANKVGTYEEKRRPVPIGPTR